VGKLDVGASAALGPRVSPEHVTVTAPAATVIALPRVMVMALEVYDVVDGVAVVGDCTWQDVAPVIAVTSPLGNVRVILPGVASVCAMAVAVVNATVRDFDAPGEEPVPVKAPEAAVMHPMQGVLT